MPPPSPTAERDRLALERTLLALERTFLAYLRTALALFGAGVGLLYLLPPGSGPWTAWLLILLGIVVLLLGGVRFLTVRWRLRQPS